MVRFQPRVHCWVEKILRFPMPHSTMFLPVWVKNYRMFSDHHICHQKYKEHGRQKWLPKILKSRQVVFLTRLAPGSMMRTASYFHFGKPECLFAINTIETDTKASRWMICKRKELDPEAMNDDWFLRKNAACRDFKISGSYFCRPSPIDKSVRLVPSITQKLSGIEDTQPDEWIAMNFLYRMIHSSLESDQFWQTCVSSYTLSHKIRLMQLGL